MTFPTDSKLLNKVIDFCHGVAEKENLKVRQSYARGDKGTEARSTFQGQEEQQGQSQEGRQADAHHCGQVAQGNCFACCLIKTLIGNGLTPA